MAAKFLQMLRAVLTGGLASFQLYGTGFGYANGDTVTQLSSKSTAVALTAWCGQIVMNNASLGATTSVVFTFTNACIIGAGYEVVVWIKSGATASTYQVIVESVTAGSCTINVRNYSATPQTDAIILGFAVRPAAIA